MNQTFHANLRGRTVIVAPECTEEFNKLYAHNDRFTANDIFEIRTVRNHGDESYISFVKHKRDPEHEHFSPYDGTIPARFFIPGP